MPNTSRNNASRSRSMQTDTKGPKFLVQKAILSTPLQALRTAGIRPELFPDNKSHRNALRAQFAQPPPWCHKLQLNQLPFARQPLLYQAPNASPADSKDNP